MADNKRPQDANEQRPGQQQQKSPQREQNPSREGFDRENDDTQR